MSKRKKEKIKNIDGIPCIELEQTMNFPSEILERLEKYDLNNPEELGQAIGMLFSDEVIAWIEELSRILEKMFS